MLYSQAAQRLLIPAEEFCFWPRCGQTAAATFATPFGVSDYRVHLRTDLHVWGALFSVSTTESRISGAEDPSALQLWLGALETGLPSTELLKYQVASSSFLLAFVCSDELCNVQTLANAKRLTCKMWQRLHNPDHSPQQNGPPSRPTLLPAMALAA